MDEFIKSKHFRYLTYSLLVLAILFFVFQLGMETGYRKAEFSFRFGDNYERNFVGHMPGMPFGREFMGGHGSIGKIIKIDLPQLIVSGRNETERVIAITPDTQIKRVNQTIKAEDLKLNEVIVVIGRPNDDGLIEAALIRVLPSPTGNSSTTRIK